MLDVHQNAKGQQMTIHERMVPRSEREKDLLKYGRSQERERIIKLLEEQIEVHEYYAAIELIKGETK
jgi:hypothetical protein